MGSMGWTPQVFWTTTPRDLMRAMAGRLKSVPKRGVAPTRSRLSEAEKAELYELLQQARMVRDNGGVT